MLGEVVTFGAVRLVWRDEPQNAELSMFFRFGWTDCPMKRVAKAS